MPHVQSQSILRRTFSVLTAGFFALSLCVTSGCFDTYRFKPEEFAKIQTPEEIPRTLNSVGGEEVLVQRGNNTYVRSKGGRRYPITAFNFKMTRSQLVASDRDILLALGDIKSYEVDHLSTWKTVLLISAGVLATGGLITYTLLSAEE